MRINHHWNNILFGCAFLVNETIESFIWLFETFLTAIGGKQPISIFIDQNQAMANAIKEVFPKSRHRLCLWPISQNAKKKKKKKQTDKQTNKLSRLYRGHLDST